jgi:apolipoprotein N-acyltransferase
MQMARMRAIENAKPLIRGTNNGITGLIDHQGQVTSQLDQFTAGVLTGEVRPYEGETPFSKFASWPVVMYCLLTIIVAFRLRKKY